MFRKFLVVTGMALLASACSDGPTTSGDPLDEAEAQAVATELLTQGFGVFGSLGSAPLASAGAQVAPFSLTFDQSAACPNGGSISVSGSISGDIDEQTSAGNLQMDITQGINGCVVVYDGDSFTVNGDPNITYQGDIEFSQTAISGTFDMEGGFSYEASDGRRGGCGIRLSVNFSNQSASGQICGLSVTFTGTTAS